MPAPSSSRLLKNGVVLTCDPAVPSSLSADVLITDGRISAVGTNLDAPADVPTQDVSGAIVLPGLVDAHQHVWEFPYVLQKPDMGIREYFAEFIPQTATAVTPDDLHEATSELLWTVMRSGTTTIFDWSHVTNSVDHADASLTAMTESGIRGIFGYGPPVALGYYNSAKPHPSEMERFVGRHGSAPTALVSISAALRGPDLSPLVVAGEDFARARDLGLKISLHIGTRLKGPGGIDSLVREGWLGPDIQLVHATNSSADELRAALDAGARIVVPPASELSLGIGIPPLARIADLGGTFGLAADTGLGSPLDMFTQMRAALLLLRLGAWDGDEPPPASRCSDVLRAATLGGAEACWLDDVTGSLTPGKHADVLVFRPARTPSALDQAAAQVIWEGGERRLELVLIGGNEVLTGATT